MAKKTYSVSSKLWIKEHFDDLSVQKQQNQGDCFEDVFKLEQIQQKFNFIKLGMRVVDLGAAPGGWSQYVASLVGDSGKVFSCDILDMKPIEKVDFIQGDFRDEAVLNTLLNKIGGKPVDIVLSDLTTNGNGSATAAQASNTYLSELAFDLCRQILKPNGVFIVKAYKGEGFDEFYSELKDAFSVVNTSELIYAQAKSNEVYLVAAGYKL
ncbi:SAM-dependent methyltransferase [Alteromonas sp. M12]|uniref:SAM-dependent methyltransferase n=1 Tax=Alteromonas sp. M12 TaxID=3135644 RepID=UPI00319DBD2E